MEIWQTIFWAVISVVLIIVEISTMQFVCVWFAAGGLVAFILSFFGIEFYWQVILFLIISTLLLIATRPFIRRMNLRKAVTTNADSVVGMGCIVKEEVTNEGGRVFVNGQDWSAKALEKGIVFPVDSVCTVVEIKGVTLMVCAPAKA